MSRSKMITIDSDKLVAKMRERGLNPRVMSREIGYSDTYIAMCIKTRQIARPAANQLKLRYNIDIDSIKPDEPVEIQQLTTSAAAEPTTGDLEKHVAELTATVKELKDEFRNYRTAMLGYMKKFENHKKYGHF